jgi:hypothetical protein
MLITSASHRNYGIPVDRNVEQELNHTLFKTPLIHIQIYRLHKTGRSNRITRNTSNTERRNKNKIPERKERYAITETPTAATSSIR